MNNRTQLLEDALADPRTRADRTPDRFIYTRDGVWRVAVTVNK